LAEVKYWYKIVMIELTAYLEIAPWGTGIQQYMQVLARVGKKWGQSGDTFLSEMAIAAIIGFGRKEL
jgi:hypothetical protein